MSEKTVFEKSIPGRIGVALPEPDVPPTRVPCDLLRADNGLPELSQSDVSRHYLRLSQRNYGIDNGFYPLGSCTMKYNPRICETVATYPSFLRSHPLLALADVQGNLELMFGLQECLREIGGFDAVSLQPSAGAHGELSGLLMMRAYHDDRNEGTRTQILVPDSAHGTNPASVAMAGLSLTEIPTDRGGNIDLQALGAACGSDVAGLMLTNPNTLGLFEQQVEEVIRLVHDCGAVVYGDGANMNALTGIMRPGDLGIDIMHYNLHKTFASPHGGGGPGSGPIGASADLAPYLPGPLVSDAVGDDPASRYELSTPKRSIGRVSTFFGNFGMMVRAYAYILHHGPEGLRANAEHAVLNANYLRVQLQKAFQVPFDRTCMHEFVCEGDAKQAGVRAIDVCKRLLDFGFHPPTNYFPLIVREALMIEPTETESLQTLDAFIAAMLQIAQEAETAPELLSSAPHLTPVRRLDEVKAARKQNFGDLGR
ncbi:MAG: glycine dehydrogenase subunit 2 [Hyphomicrobiales bacterium]|nr:glycine dehydrogenase subunit 2 [Hyphomicrobiales bacterium]MCP5001022.1 glycine dehydrogenase subunit 2 [Hyphomicrobiales bacterium]